MPDDVAQLLEGWFSLVEAHHAYELLESVLTNLDGPKQYAFAAACNGALERDGGDHRFVCRRIVPIESRSDIATIDRAFAACRVAGVAATEIEEKLLGALDCLAAKPAADAKGAMQLAVGAAFAAAFVLTGERHMTLDDALEDLASRGYIDGAMKVAHGGLFAYAVGGPQVPSGARRARIDDAKIILVTCAAFVTQLVGKM
jgi:hypothetical protein